MIRIPSRLFLPLLACAALAACATDSKDTGGPAASLTPTEQYPMTADQHPDEVKLAPHTAGLSPAQQEALAALYGRWNETGGGMVTIKTPLTGGDPAAAYYTSEASRAFLIGLGLPADRVVRAGYDAQDQGVAPIVVSYAAYEAVIPECGRKIGNLTSTGSNKPSGNFGCAVSANMAAQIADPGDIVAPRAEGPADATRRMTVLDKYRKGETSSTAADTQASASTAASSSGGGT